MKKSQQNKSEQTINISATVKCENGKKAKNAFHS